MITRPYSTFLRRLRVLGVSLVVAMFGLSAAAIYAQEPSSPPTRRDRSGRGKASEGNRAAKRRSGRPGRPKPPRRPVPPREEQEDEAGPEAAEQDAADEEVAEEDAAEQDATEEDASEEDAPEEDDALEEDDAEDDAPAPDDAEEDSAEEDGTEEDATDEEAEELDEEEAEDGELGEAEIDPELRKRVDELLQPRPGRDLQPGPAGSTKPPADRRGHTRRRAGSPSEPPDRGKPSLPHRRPRSDTEEPAEPEEVPSGPTTAIDIPPQEETVPPEERTYWFSIKDGTYEQLIAGIARETGLGVIGEAPKDGKVTFITEEELGFDDLMKRVRMLLANYKAIDPYTLLRRETHLKVVRVVDAYRDLPRERMYRSVDEYRAASLTDYDLALVLYTPKSGSVADLSVVRDFMPDYVRITPLEDRNTITIFAFVEDIEKYLELIPIFVGVNDDPRTLEVIEVEHIAASEAVEKLRTLMDLEEGGASRRRPSPSKTRGAQPSPLAGVEEPEVSVVPDDARGVIIVRAMQDKIEEIKLLLPYLDVDTSRGLEPVVIEVVHADPRELVGTIQQVLGAAEGGATTTPAKSSRRPSKRKGSRGKKPSRPVSAVTTADITLLPHPSASAIIVMAEDDDIARIRRLVEMFDVESGVSHERITLEYADANDVAATVTQLLGAARPGRAVGPESFEIVPDPSGKAIWFTGSEDSLAKVREVITFMDTADEVASLHIVRLVNQTPSFVASILSQMDSGSVGSTPRKTPSKARGKAARRRTPTPRAKASRPGKFTPDDEQGRLYILCTESEWQEYHEIIAQLEAEATAEDWVLIAVDHLEPVEAVSKVSALLNDEQLGRIRFESADDGFIVIGARDADLTTIRALLKEFDREVEIVQRTFEIRYADPAELASTVETLVSEESGRPGPAKPSGARRKGKGKPKGRAIVTKGSSDLTIVQIGRNLIVRTTPPKMERVAELITQFDVEDDQREIRVYEDFPPGADIEDLADTVASLISPGKPTGAKGKGRKGSPAAVAATGPRFIARPAARKLVVIALEEEFEEIDKLLDVLRSDVQLAEIETDIVEVKYAGPTELVQTIEPLLELQIQQMKVTGALPGTAAEIAAPVARGTKGKKRGAARVTRGAKSYHLTPDERKHRIVMVGPRAILDAARDLIATFDEPGDQADSIEVAYVPVEHGDPAEVVEMIEPLLSMKVDELINSGVLTGTTVEVPSAPPAKGGRKAVPSRKGRAPKRSRGGTDKRYHLASDERNQRIVVAAPQVIIDEAAKLIAEFDQPSDEMDIVFRTVELENSDPSDMVKAIKEMMGGPSRPTSRKGAKRPGGAPVAASDETLTVVTAPGGGALILRGLAKDVEQAEEWIAQLDGMASSGRVIKVYEIKHADIERLVKLVMYDVDTTTPARASPKKGRPARGRRPAAEPPPEEDEFTTTITRTGTEVYIQADLIERTMLVSAPPAKLARIDEIVAQLDSEEAEGIAEKAVPKMLYELEHVDAIDAMFALEAVLDVMWEYGNELPKVDYAPFGEVLIVKYPDKSRFPDIEELIVKYVDKLDPDENKPRRKAVIPPPGMTPKEFYLWLQMHRPDIEFEMIDISPMREEDFEVTEVQPVRQQASARPCVLPAAFQRMTDAVLAACIAQADPDEPEDEPTDETEPPPEDVPAAEDDEVLDEEPVEEDPAVDPAEAAIRDIALSLLDEEPEDTGADTPARETSGRASRAGVPAGEKLKVYIDESTGAVIIEGKERVLEDVDDWMEDLKEEVKDLPTLPDIRIFQVRHIDVYMAQEIINEMFNMTRQQRQLIQQQQRRTQQQARQQQLRQQRQQQQQQKGEQPGQQPGRPGQRGQQQQPTMPQLSAESVRIYPNPRDRTLIVRAESNQFTVIKKLLATIDRPQPVESVHRVFQLKKLNAGEVEELLTEWLGLNEPQRQSRPRTTQAQRGRRTPTTQTRRSTPTPGSRLPRPIMEDSPTAGPLGVDPRDIKLSSNEEANTILVMAPKAALDYIEKLINDLEGQDIAERIWKSYELVYADVDQVVEYLTSRFGEAGSTTQRRTGKGAKTRKAGGAPGAATSLNTPTFVAYPALSMISAQATEELLTEIDELIAQLDVPAVADEFKTVTLTYADAGLVTETLTEMFGTGGGGARRPGRRGVRTAPTTGTGPKFIGEEGGRVVFFSAPERLHARIHEVITELEEQSRGTATVRTIQLENAKPSAVAAAIEEAYSGRSSGRRRSGRGSRGGGATTAGFTVTPHDGSKRLYVMADNTTFAEIESLAKALDVPQEIGFDFKIYRLEYASARAVYDTLDKLVTNYLRQLGRDAQREPFSVEVDDKANALIVLGGPVVFGFVEDALKTVDIPANAASPPGFLMVPLKVADANEVAQSINRLWSQKNLAPGETPPQAEANRSLNMVIVRGTEAQLEEIRKEIIDPLEEYEPPALLSETIPLQYAQAEEVADAVTKIFEDMRQAYQQLGRGGKQPPPLEMTVAVTPDVNTNQLIVQASEANMQRIKARVAELDKEEVAGRTATSTKIYSLKVADPNAVVNIIREWTRSKQQRGGRGRTLAARDVIVAVAEPATQSVVVTASEENHALIKEVIDGLDNETVAARQRKRYVIPLKHAAAGEVANQLTQVFRNVRRARAIQPPTFVPDLNGNTIVASVNEEEYEEVQQLINALDQEPGLDTQRITKVYPLKFADPGSLNSVVLNMFRWDRRGQASPAEQVTCAPEGATQSLIITASAKNHEVVAVMIETVDKESTFTKELHTYKLEKGNADDVARALQNVYRGRKPTRRGEQPVMITPEPATNSLLILANQAEMAELEALIESLDQEPEAERLRQVKSIRLTFADPGSVQDAINQLFRGARQNPKDQVTAVPEWGSRSVIVSASPENMKRVEELVTEFDSEDANQQEVNVINLENADADSVSRTLNEIFVRSAPRQQGNQGPPITISALQGSKAVLVKCKAEDFAEIEAAVAKLDSEEAIIGEEVRIVTLLYSNAEEVKTSMEEYLRKPGGGRGRGGAELAGDIRLSVIGQTNAVVVSGDKEKVDNIETLIKQMDEAGELGSVPQIIQLEHVNVSRILPSLEEMFEEGGGRRGGRGGGQGPPTIVANENLNALVIRGSPTDIKAIQAIVAKLDTKEAGDKKNFRLIKVATGINVEDLADKIETSINEGAAAQAGGGGRGRGRAAVPSITVTPDRRTNSLMVSGTPTLFDETEELVRAMEEMGPAGGATLRIIPLTNTPSEEVIRIIEQLKGEESGGRQGRASRGSSRGSRGSARGGSRGGSGSSRRGSSRRR